MLFLFRELQNREVGDFEEISATLKQLHYYEHTSTMRHEVTTTTKK